jgi:hypothetical protein
MGLAGVLEKIGSIFVKGKGKGTDEDKLKIIRAVQSLLNHGELVVAQGGIMQIKLNEVNSMESEKLEKFETSFQTSPEKTQFLQYILEKIKTNNETSLRDIFLEFSDMEWGEKSIKQNISNWPNVINNFMILGTTMPNETNPAAILKKLGITKEEADFLSKKQTAYKKWKDAIKDGAKKRLGGKK